MKLYIVVKTARKDKDIEKFPGYFGSNPLMPKICLVDSITGDVGTPDKEKAEETAKRQTIEYGEYFNYTVYELEVLT